MENYKKAYSEILEVLKKHEDNCLYDVKELERQSKIHLFGLELKEIYGLNIDPKNIKSLEWNRFGDYRAIGLFGENHNRTISWSDDASQPKDEILLSINFPTGAYIFDGDYPVDLFQKFWLELKEYNPKYCDTVNKNIYFPLETAKDVFNNFDSILKKYRELNRNDSKLRKIAKMKEELSKLEKGS